MSWDQLLDIYRENVEEYESSRNEEPVACPNDGQPLETNEDGVLHCKFDGWVWNRGGE